VTEFAIQPKKPPRPADDAPHLLLVDDDRRIRDLLSRFLASEGYRVTTAKCAADARAKLHGLHFDLLILDVMMPGESGFDLARAIRTESAVPIIMLTARHEPSNRIVGLEMGADDYLPKPFNPRELLARIRSVLRRHAVSFGTAPAAATLSFLGWTMDCRRRELRNPEGALVVMTSAEFDLLQALCERAGRVLSREALLDLTHGRSAGAFERSIDVLVSRIRRKIEPDPHEATLIKTVRSGGYLFTPEVAAS